MKLVIMSSRSRVEGVAPLAGAWIETPCTLRPCRSSFVAPLAGAWIETELEQVEAGCLIVAPLAGAWITKHK